LINVADRKANALTLVLLLFALVTLLVGGIGIMNIMLAAVTSRIHEIGIRKLIGATNSEIRLQFRSEAILISRVGGGVGVLIGLALPFSARFPDRVLHSDLGTLCDRGHLDLRSRRHFVRNSASLPRCEA
jgi:putative ABC transport system permease protein